MYRSLWRQKARCYEHKQIRYVFFTGKRDQHENRTKVVLTLFLRWFRYHTDFLRACTLYGRHHFSDSPVGNIFVRAYMYGAVWVSTQKRCKSAGEFTHCEGSAIQSYSSVAGNGEDELFVDFSKRLRRHFWQGDIDALL